jgi:signal transduction histidine kinase
LLPTTLQAIFIASACGAVAVMTASWLAAPGTAAEPAGLASGSALVFGVLCFGLVLVLGAAGWRRLQRTRAELVESRQRLQGLADVLDVWQWHSDPEHRLTALRPPSGAAPAAWSPVAGGRPLWEVFRCDDEAGLRARLASHAPLDDIDARHRHGAADTSVRVRLRARPQSDGEGRFVGYVGILRELGVGTVDAADPKTADPAAAPPPGSAPAATGADAAHRPAADSVPVSLEPDHESFSYTVSHDLRAPIRVVEGFTRILKEDYGRLLDRIGNDHLDRVLGAASRMNAMIDALLGLSKLSSQPIARQPVNLSQLAAYVIEDLRRQSPERDVDVQITPGLQAMGDPTLLRVVLENLLGNAWKYSAKREDAKIWFERSGQENAMFCVRDNGAGFDMRFADRLFGVFQRLHSVNDFQGTGVGLASVRRIIRRHGGEIWAEAEVGRGASFHFSLPSQPLR